MIHRRFYLGLPAFGLAFGAALAGCPMPDGRFEEIAADPQCASDVDCDDGNPCTADSCDAATSLCIALALDGVDTPLAKQTDCLQHVCTQGVDVPVFTNAGAPTWLQMAGDCQKIVCDGTGGEVEVEDDLDVPSDGSDCTVDTCQAGVPTHTPAAQGAPCGQNGALYCNGAGQCVGCTMDAQCSDGTNFCQVSACSAEGVCSATPKPGGTEMPAEQQIAQDCKKWICDGSGNAVQAADPGDMKDDGNDCTEDVCNGDVPENQPFPTGTACGAGKVCDGSGACLGDIAAACSSGAECLSGSCADGVCCADSCSTQCMACNMPGSVGTCVDVPFPQTDGTCGGANVCNGNGACKLANGQPCNSSVKCASGTCDGGICKSNAGQPCVDGADCVSGSCAGNVCL